MEGANFASILPSVARQILGEENAEMSSAAELRFGRHGSVAVRLTGEKAGTWYDHENERGGGTLDLLRIYKKLEKPEALEWLVERRLIDKRDLDKASKSRIVATYDYRGPDGALRFQVVRYADPKTFKQRRPDPAARSGWAWNLQGVELVLYRLPELLAASTDATVYVVEGEKDVDNLRALGMVATCNPGGAEKWRPAYSQWLKGRNVVILPDNDTAGRRHDAQVRQMLTGVAASIATVALPGLPDKGDVSDWLASGGTVERLVEMAEDARP